LYSRSEFILAARRAVGPAQHRNAAIQTPENLQFFFDSSILRFFDASRWRVRRDK
jgi:hypothetical protein